MSNEATVTRHPAPSGAAYSDPVVIRGAGTRIEVSGQIGFDEQGAVPQDFRREVELCFEHVRRSLERAGAGMDDVVRIRSYLTDLDEYGVFSEVRAQVFSGEKPASTAVGVASLLFGARVEIEASAVLGGA